MPLCVTFEVSWKDGSIALFLDGTRAATTTTPTKAQ
jgi:hypothetical protein